MLYLHEALVKGARGPQEGAQYSGKYIKRVQVGVNADNSPKYRYLRTPEEVEAYLAQQKNKKKDSNSPDKPKLKEKLEQEHKQSKKRAQRSEKLLSKSLPLYISLGD